MRAVRMVEHGGPEVLRYEEVADPAVGPHDLLVDVTACGVNFIDTYQRSGQYPVSLPCVPGSEGAGTVTEVGSAVTGFEVGDRVAWPQVPGSYAERVALPAERAVRLPAELDSTTAAAAMLQGLTAHYLVTSTHPVGPGTVALVHAAAGGMGLLLTQWITARGGTVVGTVSTPEKERLARQAGAAEIIRYTERDIVEGVRAATEGSGVHVVYDGVGRDTFEASLSCLRPRGTLALFGAASGPVPPFDPQRLNSAGSLFLTRPTLAHHLADRAELEWRTGELFEAITRQRLRIRIGESYRLSEAARAHEDLEGRRTTGKLLLHP
ncbi:quinone oxidoreductase family protein [Actinopolyspora mortivallis]|uniref:NADPH:quinone reductase n=1 Tax=Actinopolyspora mortivallis TaxID=33906 RepID=A0A2T0H1P9_ACTMO|nr:quinone oxidoreductase [Actinopolyspora mortivallis]PRW65260.1 NADPH:quinone reductase [Actinopolyspora mortivallis]